MPERADRRLPVLAAFALALAWTGWVYSSYFRGASTFEFGEYAEIGRNVLGGHGFTTRILYPSSVAALAERGLAGVEYAPVDHRFPLPALLSATGQAALGGDLGPVAGTLLLFAVWVAFVYAAAERWLGRREAVLAAALFAAVPAGVKYFALFNLPDVAFGALLFAFHWALAELKPDASARRCAALGAYAGLLYLCRFNYWVWLPLHLAAVGWTAGKARAGAFLGGFVLVAAPFAKSMATPDAAWNLAHGTVTAAQPWLDFKTYSTADVLAAAWPAVFWKALDRLHTLILEAPMLWQAQALSPFAVVGLMRWPDGAARRFLGLSAAALVLQTLLFAPLRFDSWGLGVGYRYLYWACPLLVLLAVRGALAASESLPARWRTPALAGWLALHASFLAPFYTHDLTSIHVKHPSGRPPRDWPELAWLRERGEGVITNLPAQAGWYADVPAVALPNDPEDVVKIQAARPMRWLMVSTLNIGTLGDLPRWLDLLRPNLDGLTRYCAQHGYKVVQVMPGAVLVDLKPD